MSEQEFDPEKPNRFKIYNPDESIWAEVVLSCEYDSLLARYREAIKANENTPCDCCGDGKSSHHQGGCSVNVANYRDGLLLGCTCSGFMPGRI